VRVVMRAATVVLIALWLVSVGRVAEPQEQKGAGPPVDPTLMNALLEEGATLFGSDCAACHAAEGGESVGPPMTNNASLANKDHVIKRILDGMPTKGMPPFAASYTDRKVAAVSTFIRSSFENDFGAVVEADVRRVREESKKK
jgi:mono/diheme cytochrome c family protein